MFEMKLRLIMTVTVAFFLSLGQAGAHTDAVLASQKSPNGGQVRVAGTYHLELVMNKDSKADKEYPLTLFVTDHAGNKISTSNATGRVILLDGKIQTNIDLKPDGDNRLKGAGTYFSRPSLKAVVSVHQQGKQEQARFTPFDSRKHETSRHKH